MNYIEAISKGFPGVQCHSVGDDELYESLTWDSGNPIPSKGTLDEYISANESTSDSRRITVLAFRNRFTVSEKIKMDMASIDNPAAPMATRQLAATLRVISKDTDSANFIDLNRPDTRQGVFLMEQNGLIATGRAVIILDAIINDLEKPLGN